MTRSPVCIPNIPGQFLVMFRHCTLMSGIWPEFQVIFWTSLELFQTSLALIWRTTSLAVFQRTLALFWTSLSVKVGCSEHGEESWSCSGHHIIMSGTWPEILIIFWTSPCDDHDIWSCSGYPVFNEHYIWNSASHARNSASAAQETWSDNRIVVILIR